MSNLITKELIKDFEEHEEEWLRDEGAFDMYWEKKLQDEELFFEWLRGRFERTANHFSELSGLSGQFYAKIVDMLQEAAMTGFFFGELRWNADVKQMIDSAFNEN